MIAVKNLREVAQSMLRLRPYMRGGRYLYLGVILTALTAAALEALALGLMGGAVFLIITPATSRAPTAIGWLQSWFGGFGADRMLFALCFTALGAMAGKNLVLYSSTWLSGVLKRRVVVNLRRSLFERILSAPLRVFEEKKAGEITSVFLTDASRAFTTLETALLTTQRGAMALAYLGVLLFLSWPLTLVAVAFGIVISFPIRRVHARVSVYGNIFTQEWSRLAAHLTESFAGIRVVRSNNAQAQQIERVDARNRAQALADERYIRLAGALLPATETLAAAGGLGILLAASVLVTRGTMSADHLMTFGLVLMRLLPMINQLNGLQGRLVFEGTSLGALEKWFALPVFPERPFGTRAFDGVRREIRFEDVGLTYEDGREALRGISFSIPAGRMVALVGASGSGKTSAASLLLRHRAPTGGRILADGVDFWEFSPESWHARVAIVEQEAFLFNDTIGANVAYGAPDVSTAAIEESLRQAHLTEFVSSLPNGLGTEVGERGTALSGGQRQRLAIARALVRRPDVLVLDEATSALDSVSERQVQAAIESATRNRTVLVIAHRLSTIRNADHIVVLEEGRVVEAGTWAELMMLEGAFARLVRSGATERAEEAPTRVDPALVGA